MKSSDQKEIIVGEVRVHNYSRTELQDYIRHVLRADQGVVVKVYTPNPEIVLHAMDHPEYAAVLHRADINIPDGFGLRLVSGVSYTHHGVDIAEWLLHQAAESEHRVVCVVRQDGRSSVEQVAHAIQNRYPNLLFHCITEPLSAIPSASAQEQIATFQPQIVLVGLGFPYQEQWIDALHQHLQHQPYTATHSPRLIMAVGGTFDFWAGTAKRAPKSIQKMHLEWLWRLLTEPRRRLPRIIRAVVIFPARALWTRFRK